MIPRSQAVQFRVCGCRVFRTVAFKLAKKKNTIVVVHLLVSLFDYDAECFIALCSRFFCKLRDT